MLHPYRPIAPRRSSAAAGSNRSELAWGDVRPSHLACDLDGELRAHAIVKAQGAAARRVVWSCADNRPA